MRLHNQGSPKPHPMFLPLPKRRLANLMQSSRSARSLLLSPKGLNPTPRSHPKPEKLLLATAWPGAAMADPEAPPFRFRCSSHRVLSKKEHTKAHSTLMVGISGLRVWGLGGLGFSGSGPGLAVWILFSGDRRFWVWGLGCQGLAFRVPGSCA